MKKPGCTSDFTVPRNNELLREFRRLIMTADAPLADLYGLAAESPCSRFWTSAERTQTVISRMQRGLPLGEMYPLKLEMYALLRRKVERIMLRDSSLSMMAACEMAVHSPAPKFYLTPDSARMIITRMRRAKRKPTQI